MIGMEGNPHYTNATTAAHDMVEATLALAYEQRTANLLAFHQIAPNPGPGATLSVVAERLGVEENASMIGGRVTEIDEAERFRERVRDVHNAATGSSFDAYQYAMQQRILATVRGCLSTELAGAQSRAVFYANAQNEAEKQLVDARAKLEARDQEIDRVTDLFEQWATEEDEYRKAADYGLAEGLKIASYDLRAALHKTETERDRAVAMNECCEECAHPGHPGVCVRRGDHPCHDTEERSRQ